MSSLNLDGEPFLHRCFKAQVVEDGAAEVNRYRPGILNHPAKGAAYLFQCPVKLPAVARFAEGLQLGFGNDQCLAVLVVKLRGWL